ncbi:septation protein SepH [Hamadaea sp. NPDC051192]|uniref:septation protein SepH n=1 Tax=Hamadaea sp. NPDC051192 TaxID=3154940 RepID=UPI00343A6117
MRPVRFVALSEDGQALVLADEVGRLLALPIDDRVTGAVQAERTGPTATLTVAAGQIDGSAALSPRDIQARIRGGESADDVARVAGVPVDRVLRYAGPVLQERAMLAQHARRTKLKTADRGLSGSLAEVVDARLAQHGVDAEKISWDAYRREDGTWRVVATWPSGKATAQAIWELDKTRQSVTPYDDMAQYLCADRTSAPDAPPTRGETSRGGHGLPAAADAGRRPSRDPIRAGRDALVAALDRPGSPGRGLDTPGDRRTVVGGAAAMIGGQGTAFDDEPDAPKEVPAVPSLAVLRPRRASAAAEGTGEKPRKRLPSWDDVLFGGAPAARESS